VAKAPHFSREGMGKRDSTSSPRKNMTQKLRTHDVTPFHQSEIRGTPQKKKVQTRRVPIKT